VLEKSGYLIARVAEIPWEERRNVDGWPSSAGMYYNDVDNNLCMRLIHYAEGLTEPRHVHAGSHAAVLVAGEAHIDGITLYPMDVILGPSNEPHGPIVYPKGVYVFSAFQGSYYHHEVGELGTERHYRLIQAAELPWESRADGVKAKTLIDRGLGRLLLELVQFDAGTELGDPKITAAFVVDGTAAIDGESLHGRDFFYLRKDAEHDPVAFPESTTLLTVTMR
jgi:hypothetical protein